MNRIGTVSEVELELRHEWYLDPSVASIPVLSAYSILKDTAHELEFFF